VLYAEPHNQPARQTHLTAPTAEEFNQQLENMGINPEQFNNLSVEDQRRLIWKMAKQQ